MPQVHFECIFWSSLGPYNEIKWPLEVPALRRYLLTADLEPFFQPYRLKDMEPRAQPY